MKPLSKNKFLDIVEKELKSNEQHLCIFRKCPYYDMYQDYDYSCVFMKEGLGTFEERMKLLSDKLKEMVNTRGNLKSWV